MVYHLQKFSHKQKQPAPIAIAQWIGSLTLLAVYFAFVFWLPQPPNVTSTNGDEPHYLLLTHSLYHDHDVALLNNYQQRDYAPFYEQELDMHLFEYGTRLLPSHIMPGVPLLILPAYLLGGHVGVMLQLSVLVWLGIIYLHKTMRLYTTPTLALMLSLLTGLTYPVIAYSQLIYPETIAFSLVAFVLFHSLAPPLPRQTPRLLAVGIALACLPWLHYKMALLTITLLAFFCWKNRPKQLTLHAIRPFLWCIIPILLSGLLALAWLHWLYGEISLNVFLAPVRDDWVGQWSLPAAILGLLVDQEYGLFWYAPLYLMSFIGLWMLWRNDTTRFDALFLLFIYTSFHMLTAAYQRWEGGFSPVPRYLIAVLPILIIALAPAATKWWQHKQWIQPIILSVLTIGITAITISNQALMYGFALGSNSILREVYHADRLISVLPSFKQDAMVGDYIRTIGIAGGVGLWWYACIYLNTWLFRGQKKIFLVTTPKISPHARLDKR